MKNRAWALGLMSGTSADGVSLALAEVGAPAGPVSKRLRVRASETVPYSKALRSRILAAPRADARKLCRLHFELGRLFARTALKFLRDHGVSAKRIAAVGSHGQTVVHIPDEKNPATLQIGEASFLAEALGVPVVSDFRPRDMAAGGQGAPLVPFLDRFLFGDGPPRALQNIGGIGNVALVGRGAPTLGFDTGPGNCLIDAAVRRMTRGRLEYDRDGRIARSGAVDFSKTNSLLRLPYFGKRPPKSLDRGAFAEDFLRRHFGRELARRPQDAVSTLTCFTALTIADQYRRFLAPRARLAEVVLSGGGALNPVLMGHLRTFLSPVPVRAISDFGVPALAKEPAAFALMALRAVQGRPNHVPEATGASGPRILGKITSA
ncbi:MAG: anhydro-N-acetylmuramic acid kinase [Elusimicrobia bacterium]|nr:anhydro-N-acetylmuramic acid kinase [Elusimicrobiota bacterium]